MKEPLPINPNILRWARETIGLSEAEVASKLKKSVDIIKGWEAGQGSPTYSVLENLAYNIYKRPVAVFFFPVIPQEEDVKAAFRTLPDDMVDTMPSTIIKMYRKGKVLQLNLAELYEHEKPVQENILDIVSVDKSHTIAQLALNIRKVLDIDLVKQTVWKDADTALKTWRTMLAHKGIFIFKEAFMYDGYSGLCIYDEKYPVILINNSMPKTRQIFTVFHELAHLLFKKSGGIDVLSEASIGQLTGKYAQLEQRCNEFAGEFLFSDREFTTLGVPFSEDSVIALAGIYKVSREVVLRKYLNHNQIDARTYKALTDKWIDEFIRQRTAKGEGGNPYLTKRSYLGEVYINLAFSRYFQGKITIDGLAEYLGMKVKNIPVFEQYALGQP